MSTRGWFRNTALALGLAFLYIPILSMMVFSFNNSRMVTVWDSVSSPTLRWYVRLFENEQLLGAAWVSLQIAARRSCPHALRAVPWARLAVGDDDRAAGHA